MEQFPQRRSIDGHHWQSPHLRSSDQDSTSCTFCLWHRGLICASRGSALTAHKYFIHGSGFCRFLRRTYLSLIRRIRAFLYINNMGFNELAVFILVAMKLPLPVLATSNSFNEVDVLQRDICVIGGGASGTYAAVRLQQMGKNVALIERQSRLGGQSLRATMRTFATDYTARPC